MGKVVGAFLPFSPIFPRPSVRWSQTSYSRPSAAAVARRYVPKCSGAGRSFDQVDDSGDGFFGNPGDLGNPLGIGLPPNMTEEEIRFIETAATPQERMNRLRTIAKKRQNDIQNERIKKGLEQGTRAHQDPADSYMANLAKMSSERERELQAKLSKLSDEEIHAAAMSAHSLKGDPESPVNSTSPDPEPKEAVTSVPEAAPEFKSDLGTSERDQPAVAKPPEEEPSAPEASNQEASGNVTGKQIEFLEYYLAKLEAEAAEESGSAPVNPDEVEKGLSSMSKAVGRPTNEKEPSSDEKLTSSPASPPNASSPTAPLGDGMGDMTEEETRAAFDAIRARQAEVRDAPSADPFNVVLPSKREEKSPMSDTEALRLALIALRIETTRYMEAQEEALKEHEENVRDIFAKYVPDLD